MGKDYKNNRPRGNLLPKTMAPEPQKPCMKFQMDVEHYNRTGEIIPLTEPEEYTIPEDINLITDWYRNPNTDNEEGNDMSKGKCIIEYKPTKAELEEDVKTLTNKQIGEKYDASKSTAEKWIRDFEIKRSNNDKVEEEALLAIIAPKKQEETPKIETIPYNQGENEVATVNPSMEEIENFFTDVSIKAEDLDSDADLTDELKEYKKYPASHCAEIKDKQDPDEKIWENIEADIKALRQRKRERVDRDFDVRLRKLLECC